MLPFSLLVIESLLLHLNFSRVRAHPARDDISKTLLAARHGYFTKFKTNGYDRSDVFNLYIIFLKNVLVLYFLFAPLPLEKDMSLQHMRSTKH